jgi:hypothetical protein
VRSTVNFTGGLQAVDNPGNAATDISLATTVPNDHNFTGNLTMDGNVAASVGARNFNYSNSTGTFDTSTGQVTLRGDTATASGKTITAGLGVSTGDALTVATSTTSGKALNVTTGDGITSGSAINVDVGSSTGTSTTSGFGVNITGSGAFAGASNGASLVRVQSTGAFTGTLVKLVADSTTTGTILGISGTSLTTGRAIDVALGAAYLGQADGAGDIGAVNIRAQAFTGNIFSVSATAIGAGPTSNLSNFSSPQTDGRLLFINAKGDYSGAGALNVTVSPTTGNAVSGTAVAINTLANFNGNALDFQAASVSRFKVNANGAIVVNAPSGFTGNLEDLKVNGTSVSSVDQTGKLTNSGGLSTTGNITQTGPAATVSTGQGAVSLNGDTTIASGKTFTASQGVTNGTGSTFTTGIGLLAGTAVAIDTSTSAFTGIGGLSITSTGAFTSTGTLERLVANATTAGTVLGIDATALTTGRAFSANLGTAVYTGTGAIQVTANSATTGTLLNLSGAALGTSNGTGAKITIGTSTGSDPTNIGRGVWVSLAGAGTAFYANAASGYSGNFIDLRVDAVSRFTVNQNGVILVNAPVGFTGSLVDLQLNGASKFNVTETGAATFGGMLTAAGVTITAGNNFLQNGGGTFGTGSGAVSLNGDVTIFTGKNFIQNGGGTFGTGTGPVSLNGDVTIASGKNFTQSGAGTFATASGTNTLNGNVVIALTKSLQIGGTNGTASTPITAHYSVVTPSITFPAIGQQVCGNSTTVITLTGARVGDTVVAEPQSTTGVVASNVSWNAFVSANDTIKIRACNVTQGNVTPTAETWRIDVWRH